MSIETFQIILATSLFVLVATPILSLIVRVGMRTRHLNDVPLGFGEDDRSRRSDASDGCDLVA